MNKKDLRLKRKKSIRQKISGTAEVPRLTVSRSNRFIYAQLINDAEGKTLAAASSLKLKLTGIKAAEKVGEEIAKAAVAKKVSKIVFDRNGFKYHGAIKALADSARNAGLEF